MLLSSAWLIGLPQLVCMCMQGQVSESCLSAAFALVQAHMHVAAHANVQRSMLSPER